MIENRYAITVEGLKETSGKILMHTPRFRKVIIGTPVAIVLLLVLLHLIQPEISVWILLAVGAALLAYVFYLFRKTPSQMSENIFADMKKKFDEPIYHTKLTDGGILVLDQDDEGEDDRIFPFSTVRNVFGTEHFIVVITTYNKAVTFRRDSFVSGNEAALLAQFRDHCPQAKFGKGI